jgi:DNA-binding Lrp family transcriptional regulator
VGTVKIQAIIEDFIRTNKAATCREIIDGTGLTLEQVSKHLWHLVEKGKIKRFKISFKHSRKYGQARLFGISKAKYLYYIHRNDFLQYFASKLKIDLPPRVLFGMFSQKRRGDRGVEGILTEEEVKKICRMRGRLA